MKYYYIDTLSAAWMAEKFGMKFQVRNLPDPEESIREEMVGITRCCILDDVFESDPCKKYIHPDSLHMLEPQMGDVVQQPNGMTALVMDYDKETEKFGYAKWDDSGLPKANRYEAPSIFESGKTIQRGGKAFMWPEVEE